MYEDDELYMDRYTYRAPTPFEDAMARAQEAGLAYAAGDTGAFNRCRDWLYERLEDGELDTGEYVAALKHLRFVAGREKG